MRAGDLDRRVTLQRAAITQDTTGQEIETWSTLGPSKIWASWRRASARETLAAAEKSAIVTDVFEVRYDSAWSDLNPKDRLVYSGRTYDIAEVTEIGRREGLRIGGAARADG